MGRLVQIDWLDEAIRQELTRVQGKELGGLLDPDWAAKRVRKWLGSKRRLDDEALCIDSGVRLFPFVTRLLVVSLPDAIWLEANRVIVESWERSGKPNVGCLFVDNVLCHPDILSQWVSYMIDKHRLVSPTSVEYDGFRLVRGTRSAVVTTKAPGYMGYKYWLCTRYFYCETHYRNITRQCAVDLLCGRFRVTASVAGAILSGRAVPDRVQAEIALGKLAL